jgi:hypothetical protein
MFRTIDWSRGLLALGIAAATLLGGYQVGSKDWREREKQQREDS